MPGRYSLDIALRAKMLAIPGVAELIGDRVYADEAAPQAAPMPYVSLTLVGEATRAKSQRGAMKTWRARYQVDAYAATKAQATAIVALISARREDGGLDGFKGTMEAGAATAFVQSCWVQNPQHGSVDPASNQEARVYFAGFDLRLCFNE